MIHQSKWELFLYPAIKPFSMAIMLALCLASAGCSGFSSSPEGRGRRAHLLIKDVAPQSQTSFQRSEQPARSINVTGHWTLGFRVGDGAQTAKMDLAQNGETFSGSGQDDQNGLSFIIDNGIVRDGEISFVKKYKEGGNAAIAYKGGLSLFKNDSGEIPYMSGQYSVTTNDHPITGDWEAAMTVANNSGSLNSSNREAKAAKNVESTGDSAATISTAKAPDLSGKWRVGYESNFKVLHSILYLEQDGNKLSGHGFDSETKARFIIAKGWYKFPHVTLIRKYERSKHNPGQELTFKADVSLVSDPGYSGPYLSGKTQGGGNWEAELVK